MKQTLESLWNGTLAPGPNCGVHDPELERLTVLMDRNREQLCRELSQPQRVLFDKYADCVDEFTYLISTQAFTDGFSLASKLLAEALIDTKN